MLPNSLLLLLPIPILNSLSFPNLVSLNLLKSKLFSLIKFINLPFHSDIEGTNFIISFTPLEYGKQKTGKLVIQTDEMLW